MPCHYADWTVALTLRELLNVLREHLALVVILPIVCAVVCAVACLFLPNQYTASTTMYVLAQDEDSKETAYSSISASQMITNDVATLMKSARVASEAANKLGLASIGDYDIDVTSSTTTRVITLAVTGPDAQTAADVANALVSVTSDISQNVMNLQSVNAIDQASAPTHPSGPNRPMYIAVAFIAGLFVAIAICVLRETLNTKVRGDDDIKNLLDVPVIGHVPAVEGR